MAASMMGDDMSLLHALQPILGDVKRMHPMPDPRPWSRTYALDVQAGTRVYLKGTPRSRPEGLTTALLSACCPVYLPEVLHADVLPESGWCWFLTADVGDCAHTQLPLHVAEQAAFALGSLQRVVQTAPVLAQSLPVFVPHQLHQIVLASCDWLIQQRHPAVDARVETYRTRIAGAGRYFRTLAHQLSVVPATCVHGDFWPGNIGVYHDHVKLIDWGEALWGIGGASIWNLLLSSQATLAPHTEAIWHAYGQGWERHIAQEYIDACRTAFTVMMLVVDDTYIQWHPAEVDLVPGILTTIQQVVRQLE